MAYVVTKSCLGNLDRSCVEVCPVDCFYYIKKAELNSRFGVEAKSADQVGMLMIHASECISCGACETECPHDAIFEDTGVPADLQEFIKLNEDETAALTEDELDAARCTGR